MCMRSPRPQTPPTPPPPPPPPAETAESMADPGQATARREGSTTQRAKRRGPRALKISLAENVGGGSGTNIGY